MTGKWKLRSRSGGGWHSAAGMSLAFMVGLGLWLAAPVIQVEGPGRCPSAAEVSTRVGELLPGATNPASDQEPDVVLLDEGNAGLRISMRGADGSLRGQRLLEPTASCSDLAAAAAVVIAVWQSEAHPEFTSRIDAGALPAPAVAASITYDLGAALLWSVAGTAQNSVGAPGATMVATWTAGATAALTRFGLRAAFSGTTEREHPLSSGAARWRRLTLALGPQIRFAEASRRWSLDVHAAALGARLSVRGVNFAMNLPSSALEPGVGAGTRLMLHQGRAAVWLELTLARWLREQFAVANPGASSTLLPRLEGQVALGVSFCNCP